MTASVVGVYALIQRNEARRAEENAKKQQVVAEKATIQAKAQTLLAEKATERAEAQTRIATSRQLAALSVAERDRRFDRSLLLAVEAIRAGNTFEARESLYQALRERPGLASFLHVDEGSASSVAFSPDGKTSRPDTFVELRRPQRHVRGGVVLWDVAGCKRMGDGPLAVEEGHVTERGL